MLTSITRNWWKFLLRGAVSVVVGALAFIWPTQAIQALVLLFGAFVLVDGIISASTGFAASPYFKRWWALLLEGVAGIVIGLVTFFWPSITALALLYLIAAWSLVTGIFEIVAAVELRQVITGEWAMILSGLLSILFGVLLSVFPVTGAVSLAWLFGFFAVVFGISQMAIAFRLHGLGRDLKAIQVTSL